MQLASAAAIHPFKPPEICQRGQDVDIGSDVVWEWREYVVTSEGADALRVGTDLIPPLVPSRFLIRFENRVGYSTIQPLRNGNGWGPGRRVEVASAKLGGYSAYRAFTDRLLHDLYRHGAEKVFDLAGQTSFDAQGPVGEKSWLFCLHYLLNKRVELLEAFEVVCERPHLSLIEQRETRRLSLVSRGGKDLIDGLLRGRRGWDRADHLASGAAMGGFLPTHVETMQGSETSDNPENRFALGLGEMVADLIRQLQRARWWPKVPLARRLLLDELLHEMVRRADHPLFGDVGKMTSVPAQSRVLTRREGYRQLYAIWSVLNQPATPLLAHLEHAIELRDVDVLYEQWCFFELAEQIGMIVGAAPRYVIPLQSQQLPWEARAEFPDGASLVYNGTRSGYSLPFRPDLLWSVDQNAVAVFDAKFRAEVPKDSKDLVSDPRRADIDKMHTYRDALGVVSATVLYPGSECCAFSANAQPQASVTLRQLLEGWTGVSAIPFRPGAPHGD